MATVAPSSETADLLQNLSLDSEAKTFEIPEPTKKVDLGVDSVGYDLTLILPFGQTSVYQYGGVESGIPANGQIQSSERSVTPFLPDLMDPTMCYLPSGYPSPAYYYGYNGNGNEWDDYSRYAHTDGVEMSSGVYGDNGPVMYHNGYGYAPYGPYSPAASPVPTLVNDGQIYGPQHYQYPAYFQPLTPNSSSFTPSQAVSIQGELTSSTAPDQKPKLAETKVNSSTIVNGGGLKGNNGSIPTKPTYQNSLLNLNNTNGRGIMPGGIPAAGYQDPKFGFDGKYRSTGIASSFLKANNTPSSRNHNFRQNSSYMGLHHLAPISGMGSTHGYINGMYPNKFYGQYGNTFRSSMGIGSTGYDSRINANGWLAIDSKYKPRGRGNGYFGYRNEGIDGLNELNRGPRARGFKNQKGFTPVTLVVKGQNVPSIETVTEGKDETVVTPDKEQYNKADFPEDYVDAKIFVIKSYSEDDVHKSIKYNVWASTPNGNKKLDAAYQEAQQKSSGCPVFLFFSVNTSGQFVGLAEMVGPVDFHKNVEYWQQDKWTGCFPLKWHIVKDIPNSLLKHITLENNENKPVTNSRDTQEVKLEQGLKMFKIFKDHSSKTCILDDFGFYERRQTLIQEKKAKQQQLQKQVLEGKLEGERKVENVSHSALEVERCITKLGSDATQGLVSTAQSNGDSNHSENGPVAKAGDASENQNIGNGIVNVC
ncbi:YTH domain-containing protein ECT4 isoform X2 [Manihot esculenta]|uniref:YTH domain-containing protein ECT4 isoform X2 n=1 Tax=Manihot esculenta TaxID=3983 RepID=UPI000B5D6362|nr:YTH domain-containing protein ECT4 isoform X2 [Manihot esculenta]